MTKPAIERLTDDAVRIFHGGMVWTAFCHPNGEWIVESKRTGPVKLPPDSCPCCYVKGVIEHRRRLPHRDPGRMK